MRKQIFLLLFIPLFSFAQKRDQIFDNPQKVIVAGKVSDYHPDYRKINIAINRLGYPQESLEVPFDSAGYFKASFETYLPTDILISYRTYVMAIVHPNDSIYVEFDASKNTKTEVLKTIKYGGDARKTNQDISLMQMKYEGFRANTPNERTNALKNLKTNEFLSHVDSVFQYNTKLYNEFVEEASPTDEAKLWALMYIEQAYLDALSFYPMVHPSLNNLNNFEVELSYYDPLVKHPPLTTSMLTNANSMDSYISNMYRFVAERIKESTAGSSATFNQDSLYTYGIIDQITDPLLRQLVLFRKFYGKIDQNQIGFYERYIDLVDLYIKEPFLRNPLNAFYAKRKNELDAPKALTDSVFKELSKTTVGSIFDSILSKGKGKVIYIDCWAVWCGPCIGSFPDSKKLHNDLKGQAIEFVYLCIESDSVKWQDLVKKHELEGQHYLLNPLQSKELRKAFEIDGVPRYILMDKKGLIVEKDAGSPGAVAEKIKKLINE